MHYQHYDLHHADRQVSKTNAANCPACPSCVDLASATVDVAHMAETTKIDSSAATPARCWSFVRN